MTQPKLLHLFRKKSFSKEQFFKDMIAGIIVAIIALPLSIALGISSGVSPEKGLITAIIAGFFISFLGGSSVQIGGPTGAFVVIVYGIIEQYGIEGLIIATLMSGIILVILGLLKLGSLIKFIPYPITVGFTAGIAVTLFTTQIKDFLGLSIDKVPSEFIPKVISFISNINTINFTALLLGIASIAIILLWPKINKTIPGSLIALIITTLVVCIFDLPVATIGSQFGQISSKFPSPSIPNVNLNTILSLIKPAFTIAILAGIESLLSAVVSDKMINDKHDSNMELIGQGVANIFSGLFGGIPATGAIARTAANVKNGGRTPISGIIHAITLFLIMKIFMPYAKFIPLTTLAAILMIVSYNMGDWSCFKSMLKAPKSDILILFTTFILTVVFDLVIAIEVGMVITMCLFIRKMSLHTKVNHLPIEESVHDSLKDHIMIYDIDGPLFFGATDTFHDSINNIIGKHRSKKILILNMDKSKLMDITAYTALESIEEFCTENKIRLILSQVHQQPMKVITNMGLLKRLDKNNITVSLNEAVELANSILIKQKVIA
ncbi:SulP family inorganic anion transporter [Clostridium sp. CTA-19]